MTVLLKRAEKGSWRGLPRAAAGVLAGLALGLAAGGAGAAACEELDCLLCPALSDPANYESGNMKLVRELTPGRDRWLFRSEVDLTNDFGMPARMEPEFARLMETFRRKGTRVAIAVQPTRGLMHRDKIRPDQAHGFDFAVARASLDAYLKQLRHNGAIVPDVMSLVDEPPEQEYFFRRDHHWTSYGARATARVVADELLRQPFLAELAKSRYRTEPGVTQFKDGTLNLALAHLCGNHYGFQYVQGYRTVPDEVDANALFDEQPVPEVIVVGTSNAGARDDEGKQFNFDGFLKEYLSVDMLNFAMPGAGEHGSLLEFLHSDSYSPEAPPRLIIWELPANYRLEDPLMYRQLIPAIEGGCARGEQLLTSRQESVQLRSEERVEVLANSGEQRLDLAGEPGFLELRVGNRNFKHFYVIVYYDNGARDKVWFRREAIVTGGLYRLELSRAPEFRGADLLSVFIEPTQTLDAPTSVEVSLCR